MYLVIPHYRTEASHTLQDGGLTHTTGRRPHTHFLHSSVNKQTQSIIAGSAGMPVLYYRRLRPYIYFIPVSSQITNIKDSPLSRSLQTCWHACLVLQETETLHILHSSVKPNKQTLKTPHIAGPYRHAGMPVLYYRRLRPYIHFIPVSSNTSNTSFQCFPASDIIPVIEQR